MVSAAVILAVMILGRQRQQAAAAAEAAADPAEDASARVRRKILETIKRGINENRGRTDLADGERRMLEHMCAFPPPCNPLGREPRLARAPPSRPHAAPIRTHARGVRSGNCM